MAQNKLKNKNYRLVPFFQNRSDILSFFLASPHKDHQILNFIVDLEDFMEPDNFFDILSVAVDSLMQTNRVNPHKPGPKRTKPPFKNIP